MSDAVTLYYMSVENVKEYQLRAWEREIGND